MVVKFDVTVAAIAQTAGRFLLVEERINRRLVFNQPAGHVEDGETLLTAVIRETREETAWQFEPQTFLGVYLWRNPANGRRILRFAFTGAVSDHDAAQRLDRGIVGPRAPRGAAAHAAGAALRARLPERAILSAAGGCRTRPAQRRGGRHTGRSLRRSHYHHPADDLNACGALK